MSTRIFDHATITYVVDGDTCDIEIDLGFSIYISQRFRLLDINTPERSKPGFIEAREFLAQFMGLPLTIEVVKIDKYGRYLATLRLKDGLNINQALLEHGLAIPYTRPAASSVSV